MQGCMCKERKKKEKNDYPLTISFVEASTLKSWITRRLAETIELNLAL